MFKTTDIKNAKKTKDKKLQPKSLDEIKVHHSWERTMPYYSTVYEQVEEDKRYQSLTPQDQGQFLRVVHYSWKGGGMFVDHPGAVATKLSLLLQEWTRLRRIFIEVGLLIFSADGNYLIQPELREQFLQTVETNNNKRRV
jgi:hypothetical protein